MARRVRSLGFSAVGYALAVFSLYFIGWGWSLAYASGYLIGPLAAQASALSYSACVLWALRYVRLLVDGVERARLAADGVSDGDEELLDDRAD